MTEAIEAQQKAAVFLARRRPKFEPKSAERLAAEREEAEKLAVEEALAQGAGAEMPDGSIYLGRYKNKDWFVAAEDIKGTDGNNLLMTFNEAAAHVKTLDLHGHNDWQLPPGKDDPNEPDILKEMFNHRSDGAFKGTYHEAADASGSGCPVWYWSSTENRDLSSCVNEVRFSDGYESWHLKDNDWLSCRPVRLVPRP